MRRLLVTLGLGVAGAVGGLLLTFFAALLLNGSSPHEVLEAFSVSIIGALCGAIALPLYWAYRRIRRDRRF